jgi:hypothetical protein
MSWLTADPEIAQVQLIGGGFYDDARGANFSGKTHYVIVTGLQVDLPYWFDVVSGGTRSDNAGTHWAVNTGAVGRHADSNRLDRHGHCAMIWKCYDFGS